MVGDVAGDVVSDVVDSANCTCPALLVTAPSSNRDIVGIYSLLSCLYAGREVYIHASGNTFLFYNESSSTWVSTDSDHFELLKLLLLLT